MKLSTIIILYLIALNINYQYIWRSQERLWEHTISIYPRSYRAHENLAKLVYASDPLRALYHFDASSQCVDGSRGKWSSDMLNLYRVHCDKVIDQAYRRFRAGREQIEK